MTENENLMEFSHNIISLFGFQSILRVIEDTSINKIMDIDKLP